MSSKLKLTANVNWFNDTHILSTFKNLDKSTVLKKKTQQYINIATFIICFQNMTNQTAKERQHAVAIQTYNYFFFGGGV